MSRVDHWVLRKISELSLKSDIDDVTRKIEREVQNDVREESSDPKVSQCAKRRSENSVANGVVFAKHAMLV